MRARYLDTPHGQVHARTAGRAGPWLVLHHESPLSSSVFDAALPHLGAWCRAVALDTPGYGQSDPPDGPLALPAYATRLLAAARIATGGEPFAVAGVHTGASIAVEVARQGGDAVTAVTLMGLPAYDERTRAQRLATWAPPRTPDAGGDHLRWAWERYTEIWPDATPDLRHRAVVDLLGVLGRYHWAYEAAFRHDPLPALAALRQPVQFIAAGGDPLTPADERAAAATGARIDHLPDLPGQIAARAPRELSRLLRDFLTPLTPGR